MKFTTVSDLDEMPIEEIHRHYRRYINPGQVSLLASFEAGRDTVASAEGLCIRLNNGRTIKDFTGGIGVLNLGHNHADILEARRDYSERKRLEVHKNYFNPALGLLSEKLVSLSGFGDGKVYIGNSGAEAVECAVKLAFKYFNGSRSRIISIKNSFHGKTLGAGGLTGSPEVDFKFPSISGIDCVPMNEDCSEIEDIVRQGMRYGQCSHYALIVEPFVASAILDRESSQLQKIRDICDKFGIILIFDEVYTGFGKTGGWFSYQKKEVLPDIVVCSKSLGGGKASLSAVISRDKFFDRAYGKRLSDALIHSSTYNAFGEEVFTALRAIEVIENYRLIDHSQVIGDVIETKGSKLLERFESVREFRGSGCLHGVIFGKTLFHIITELLNYLPLDVVSDRRFEQKLITSAVSHRLYNKHSILTYFGLNEVIPLKISPPIITETHEIDRFFESLTEVLDYGLEAAILDFVKFKYGV